MVILDINMPTKCMNCPLLGRDSMYCQIYPRKDLNLIEVANGKPEWCPIVSESEEEVSDTVKLIIDFPNDKYTRFVECYRGNNNCDWLYRLVADGIQLDNIKAEIKAKANEHIFYTDCGRIEDGLYEALKIIDKHLADMNGDEE